MDLDIPQAWPISPLLILIYTSSLHTNISECGAHVMWFIDDITIYKSSRDIDKNNTKPREDLAAHGKILVFLKFSAYGYGRATECPRPR